MVIFYVIEEGDFLIELGVSIYKLSVMCILIFNYSTAMRALCPMSIPVNGNNQ